MKNHILSLIERDEIARHRTVKVKEKDKENKETEKEITRQIDSFQIGDTVDVHQFILEGAKTRIQVFNGVVISRRGESLQEMFTVRRIVQGEGVERQFPLNSPKIAKIEVKRTGTVRRAKLYYLRDRVGKATRLRERKVKGAEAAANEKRSKKKAEAAAAAVAAANKT
jgi:large subunit ribosomal protein L19